MESTRLTRVKVLDDAKQCVTVDRNVEYGPPEQTFVRIADLWSTHLTLTNGKGVYVSMEDVCWMMIQLKQARAMNGFNADNFIDVAGYAACAGEIAQSFVDE